MLPWPEIITTGKSGCCALMRSNTWSRRGGYPQPYVKEDEVRLPSLDCPECFIRRAGSDQSGGFVLEDARH